MREGERETDIHKTDAEETERSGDPTDRGRGEGKEGVWWGGEETEALA